MTVERLNQRVKTCLNTQESNEISKKEQAEQRLMQESKHVWNEIFKHIESATDSELALGITATLTMTHPIDGHMCSCHIAAGGYIPIARLTEKTFSFEVRIFHLQEMIKLAEDSGFKYEPFGNGIVAFIYEPKV